MNKPSHTEQQTVSPSPAPFPHWMLREIHEQPETLRATLDRYAHKSSFIAETCDPLRQWLRDANGRFVIAASGSSRHAGQVGEILIEDSSGMDVDVEYSSEYLYRDKSATKQASVLVISQSGETVDTLLAMSKASQQGSQTMAITNVADSSTARAARVSFPTLAGVERAIPATKSFTAQLLNLYLLSLLAAELHGKLPAASTRALLRETELLPAAVARQLSGWEGAARNLAELYGGKTSFLFVGRGAHYPIAREGALKLKESAYLSAEGLPSGELKHGPNALLSDSTPLVMLATVDHANPNSVRRYDKVLALMRDMRQQGAEIIAVANSTDDSVRRIAHHTVPVDETVEGLLTISETIPLQLFAYFMAVHNGIDVDNPRNLSKAVLAE